MGFLGIGAMEALVIVVIALIIFGPGRLPEIMGEAGRMVRDFRRATRDLTADFEDSVSEVRGTYREIEDDLRDTASGLQRDAQSMADEVNTAVSDASQLDGDARPPARGRPRADRLDQVVEPRARDERSTSKPNAAQRDREPVRSTSTSPAARSPNGANEPVEDLLSVSDGDDLLAMDEPE